MLKLALICLAVAIVAGILGLVVHVTAAIAKLLFVIFLAIAIISGVWHMLTRSKTGS